MDRDGFSVALRDPIGCPFSATASTPMTPTASVRAKTASKSHNSPWRATGRPVRRSRKEADAQIRTGDPFITRVDQLSLRDAQSRAKSHGSKERARPRWRPKTTNDKDVDPA